MTLEERYEHMMLSNSKLDFFYELVDALAPIDHWCYNRDGHLSGSNSENERILDTLFSLGGIKDYMLTCENKRHAPLILSSSLGNIWLAVTECIDGEVSRYHVLGPVFMDAISNTSLQKRVDGYDSIPLTWKKHFIELVRSFPTIPWNTLVNYTVMLHYVVNGEKITVSDFIYQTAPSDAAPAGLPSPASDETVEKQCLPWLAEQTLLENIREGSLNFKAALANASNVSTGVKINTGDPLLRTRVSASVFAALCARAAIDGGLSASASYALQNTYTQSILGCESVSEIADINHQMYEDFIRRVHKLKERPNISPQIRSCMEYIDIHAAEKLSISGLARSVGYTDYYLSRKFKKETGTSINEYIRLQKMRLAKNLLVTTNLSVQEISEQLGFCSRSYFADTFHKTFGRSPTDYREEERRL